MTVYLRKRGTDIEATGIYDVEAGTLIVLKGSHLSKDISHSEKFRSTRAIEKSREGIVKENILQENVMFKSSSTAANFVTGQSTNGLITWKDKDGRCLKEILQERSV